MILLTVLSLNVFGDGLRDALDPKSKVRLEARTPAWSSRRGRRSDGAASSSGAWSGWSLVLFAVSVHRLPDLQRDPELRPGAADGRQERDAGAGREHRRRNGASTNRCPQQYLTMMKKIFTGELISYSNQLNVDEQIVEGIPATFSLCIGAAVIWMFFGILFGYLSAVRAGGWLDRLLTVRRDRRDLDAGLLARRGLPLLPHLQDRNLPLRRLRGADRRPARMGLPPDPALVHAGDPLRSASTAACCARTCST